MTYWHWLAGISMAFVAAERLLPARAEQPLARRELSTDLAYLVLHGYAWWWLFGGLLTLLDRTSRGLLALPDGPAALGRLPWWVQLVGFLVVADFLQWCVHNLLHRVPWLWTFHKVHHAAHAMDWAVNFRFHWLETVVYRTLLFVPLAYLGGEPSALFWAAVLGTAWGHFNHANLDVSLGPLGFVMNSPRMHMWHHDASSEGGVAKNFAIVFSLWDYLFGTAYWPRDRAPGRIGYPGDAEMPGDFARQLAFPLTRSSTSQTKSR